MSGKICEEITTDMGKIVTCAHCSKWSLSFTLVVALVMPGSLYHGQYLLGFSCEIEELNFLLIGRHLVSHWECRKDEVFPLQKVKAEAGFHR